MFIKATPLKRGRHNTVLINTDQIVSVESRLLFMDVDYRVTMSNGKQFIVADAAMTRLRTLMYKEDQMTDKDVASAAKRLRDELSASLGSPDRK